MIIVKVIKCKFRRCSHIGNCVCLMHKYIFRGIGGVTGVNSFIHFCHVILGNITCDRRMDPEIRSVLSNTNIITFHRCLKGR
jgi:hypothetical protein